MNETVANDNMEIKRLNDKKLETEASGEDSAELEEGAAEDASAQPESADAGDGDPPPAAQAETGATEAEMSPQERISDLKDQLLRALAEVENTRRRARREREDTAKYAIANFARDVLAVSDNLARALEAVPEDARAGNDAMETLYQGVELTQRELQTAMDRHGIRQVDPLGEKFDHNFHQAMFEVESPDAEPGTVVQVAQHGYVIDERLLRPAMVGVAKKPPPPDVAEESSGDEPDAESGS